MTRFSRALRARGAAAGCVGWRVAARRKAARLAAAGGGKRPRLRRGVGPAGVCA